MIKITKAKQVANIKETTDAYRILVENFMAKDCLGDLSINVNMMLKLILEP
jgi:hypothetical protein